MINLSEDPRAALELTRYHSWRRLRDQSIGEHSCQILRILLTVWPDCPRRMLVYAVAHDMGEMAGDIQYPYKLKYPELKPLMDRVEADVKRTMATGLGMPPVAVLSDYELRVFKLVEFVEMWELGLTEQGMGNHYASVITQRCILAANEIVQELVMNKPPRGEAPDVVPAIVSYIKRRGEWESSNGASRKLGEQHD